MKTTTRQLIRMLWHRDQWYTHCFFSQPWLEATVHKQTGQYFYSDCGCVHLWGDTSNRLRYSWSLTPANFLLYMFVIAPLSWRATRFARSHSYVPSEKSGVQL